MTTSPYVVHRAAGMPTRIVVTTDRDEAALHLGASAPGLNLWETYTIHRIISSEMAAIGHGVRLDMSRRTRKDAIHQMDGPGMRSIRPDGLASVRGTAPR